MKEPVAIKVEHVYKHFKLPHEKITSIKTFFTQSYKRRKGFEIQHALEDISFEVKQGEFFGIVGRNGSGKSTLLKILAEIYQPTKGKVQHVGRLVPFIELGVGFNPELTGRENVYLNGALLGLSKKQVDERYDEIVEFAELEDFMDQKLKNYSSGMQVRLAFSVATRGNTADILLIDEVLAVGDADFQRKCYEYFKGLKKTNTTIVFVTHDMNAVREYCDSAVLIEDGVIKSQGAADVVADKYLQLFNGSDTVVTEDDSRWGTREVRMDSVKVKSTKETIAFDIDITSDIDLEEFVIGFNFRNSDDTAIMGGNSMNVIECIGDKSIIKGESKRIIFEMPNFLGTGQYSLEVAVKKPGGIILDKMTNAGKVKVTKTESYYPTIALAKMSVKTIHGGKKDV